MFIDNETLNIIISEFKLGKSLDVIEKTYGYTRNDIKKAVRNYVGNAKEYKNTRLCQRR